jgi:hypothetical protein
MYCRPWFVDHENYRKQAPLRVPKGFLADLPEDLRRLLVRAQEGYYADAELGERPESVHRAFLMPDSPGTGAPPNNQADNMDHEVQV